MSSLTQIHMLQHQMIIDYCHEVNNLNNHPTCSGIIQKCCDYIIQHTHELILLEDLSEYCNMSPRRLSLKFKKELNVNIMDYIRQSKMDEAKLLLKYGTHTISEISCHLGYGSQSYFTAVFKKYLGVTPLQYKRNNNTEK